MAQVRFLNRLRIVLDRRLTAANALDLAHIAHPDCTLFQLDRELPYRGLSGKAITARMLLPFVNRVGNVLRRAGLGRRERVAIWKTNGLDYFFLGLAIIKAGGVAVPINPGMGLAELRSYLAQLGVRMMISDVDLVSARIQGPGELPMITSWFLPRAPDDLAWPHVNLDRALGQVSDALEPAPLGPDDEVLIVHTSGTTGIPKGVITTSASVVRGIKGHFLDEPISTKNRVAVAGQFNHLVYYLGFYTSMVGNFQVWALCRPEPGPALDLIDREKINIFFAFPDFYLRMYHTGLDRHDLSSMRIWIATADASHEVHMRAFCQKGACVRIFGLPILRSVFIEPLGTSEVGFAALRRFRFSFSALRFQRMVGRPSLAGPRVRIADEQGRSLRPGRIGRLMVKGGTTFKGYCHARGDVEGKRHDGWWWTGDVAYRDWLGRFYHLDRWADVVRSRSGNVYTLLIEETLLSHPAVCEAVVFGAPDPAQGEAAMAVVCAKVGHVIDPEACRAWANRRLTPPVALARVVVTELDDIPRGLTGKVLKRVLRERYLDPLGDRASAEEA